jgi:tyrosinase
MLTSKLFAGNALLQALADNTDRMSRTRNSIGEPVRLVQTALLTRNPAALPLHGADGRFGNETAAAVRTMKSEEFGLPAADATEIIGPRTITRLDEIQAASEVPPAPSTLIRRSVWDLQADATWQPIPLAYARAVRVMQARPITDPTSWRFQAAVHGSFSAPPAGSQWSTCQHRSWYFLPWHRMYLHFFERIVRSIVIADGGPADFAIPYWNYELPFPATQLPVPMRLATLPDGTSNPLHLTAPRRDPLWDQGASMPAAAVNSTATMAIRNYIGPPGPGFGGGRSAPAHFGGSTGGLEQTPHNAVHPLVGGPPSGQCQGGLMTDPSCAALDPVFWLHHANIDRLWTNWLTLALGRANPTDAAWLNQAFTFFDEAGTPVTMRCGDVVDSIGQLGYRYDDAPAPLEGAPMMPEPTPASAEPPELGGASEESVELRGEAASVRIAVPGATEPMMASALEGAGRMYLNVEDIEGVDDPGDVYAVYLNLPEGADEAERARHHVGNVSFFGLRSTANPDIVHEGAPGLGHTFDVTDVVQALTGELSSGDLTVTFEPLRLQLPEGAVAEPQLASPPETPPVRIGRVSLFVG